jgi:hypothetical protein
MERLQRYWPWIALFLVIAIIFGAPSLPWPIVMLAMGGGGAYLLHLGWRAWQRASGGGIIDNKRTTYWRGQRIELDKSSRRTSPTLSALWPALLYLTLGALLVLSALSLLVDGLM